MSWDASTTTDELIENLNLEGKTAIITGASGGIGAETARALASAGATVIVASRDLAKTELKAQELRQLTNSGAITAEAVDLADFDSIRRAADRVLQQTPSIDILINNAGVMACPLQHTEQGFEAQFGVNHLGHFLWTLLLQDALSNTARVVVLCSDGHKLQDIDLDDLNWGSRDYDKWLAYGASKTANILFAVELNSRLQKRGITANAVHPGAILTDLGRHLSDADINELSEAGKSGHFEFKTLAAGAATSVWAATATELEGRGGLYLENCQIGPEVAPGTLAYGYHAYARDKLQAERLWLASEHLCRHAT